jgi:hypothetical protein
MSRRKTVRRRRHRRKTARKGGMGMRPGHPGLTNCVWPNSCW